MPTKIGIPKQTVPGETRVALVPTVVKKLVDLGTTVLVESGAGLSSGHADGAYHRAGASVLTSTTSAWAQADLVAAVHPPTAQQASQVQQGAILIGMLAPLRYPEIIETLAKRGATTFSLEMLPRISRAQPMDTLSSQANVAGYMAAVIAASACAKMFPMMITAAGTLAPAKVFVIGAGVAGLQAIATAKRLGAVVEGYDVRPEVKEQVQSVGGRFVELPTTTADAQSTGGYAKQQSDQDRQRQIDLMTKHVIGADVVITTAAIFGKDPPLLIPNDVVEQMKSGCVIVDLAADERAGCGNCEATHPGRRYTTDQGIVIEGATNLPAWAPAHSSQMFANNVFAFIKELFTDDTTITLNPDDELQQATLVTHQGHIVHPLVAASLKP